MMDQFPPDDGRDPPAPPPPPPAADWTRPASSPGVPPPPPPFRPQSSRSFIGNLARGLGIALLGCIAVLAGLFGACMMIVGGTSTDAFPYVIGASVLFAAAIIALFFLIRPRKIIP